MSTNGALMSNTQTRTLLHNALNNYAKVGFSFGKKKKKKAKQSGNIEMKMES